MYAGFISDHKDPVTTSYGKVDPGLSRILSWVIAHQGTRRSPMVGMAPLL